eukprot:SM000243S08579  [mRNA]  locus=s243:106019:110373:+ [translate_table: standard]
MRWHGTYDTATLLSAFLLEEQWKCYDQPAGAEAAVLKSSSHGPLQHHLEQLANTGKLPDLRKVLKCSTNASCDWQAAAEAQAPHEDYDGAELLTAEFEAGPLHAISEGAYSVELEALSDPSLSGPVSPQLLAASGFGCSPGVFQAPPHGVHTCHSVSSTTSTTHGSPFLSSMDDDGASEATARLLDWPADDAVSQPPYMTEPPALCAPLPQAAITASKADALLALKTKSFLEERRAIAHRDAEQSALAACQPQQGTAASFLPSLTDQVLDCSSMSTAAVLTCLTTDQQTESCHRVADPARSLGYCRCQHLMRHACQPPPSAEQRRTYYTELCGDQECSPTPVHPLRGTHEGDGMRSAIEAQGSPLESGSFDHGLVIPQRGNIAPADVIHEWQMPEIKQLRLVSETQRQGGCGNSLASSEGPQHYVPDITLIHQVIVPNENNHMKRHEKKKMQKRKVRRPENIFRYPLDHNVIPEDGYRWRKYGQKNVKGSDFPRCYYRCCEVSPHACDVKKKVERDRSDPDFVLITYDGQHLHELPGILQNLRVQTLPNRSLMSKREDHPAPALAKRQLEGKDCNAPGKTGVTGLQSWSPHHLGPTYSGSHLSDGHHDISTDDSSQKAHEPPSAEAPKAMAQGQSRPCGSQGSLGRFRQKKVTALSVTIGDIKRAAQQDVYEAFIDGCD